MVIKEYEIGGFRCRCAFPDSFQEGERYPVLFFLHGAGERGDDLTKLSANGPLFEVTKGREYPAIVVAPQLPEGTWFDVFERLQAFVDTVLLQPYADTAKVYLSGVSMGGYASWQLLMSKPKTFAAAMICCGGGMAWNTPAIVHIPVWAFHGALDDVVPVDRTIEMTNAINVRGGNAKLTVYADSWHDCWVRAFADDAVYEWLFAQKK